jgi:hypothetical protein
MIPVIPGITAGREEPNYLRNNSDPPLRPGKCGSISGQLTFPRYTLMWFIHALDAIFELMAVVRKLLSHFIDAAWHVATERGPDGDNLTDFELVGGHRFLDVG